MIRIHITQEGVLDNTERTIGNLCLNPNTLDRVDFHHNDDTRIRTLKALAAGFMDWADGSCSDLYRSAKGKDKVEEALFWILRGYKE